MGYKLDPNADLFPEGYHFFEVTGCMEKPTRAGVMRFQVVMKDLDTSRVHTEKWWVEGEWVGMSVGKFKALGVDLNDLNPSDLIGRRFYGKVKHRPGKGDFGPQASIGSCYPEDAPPKGYLAQKEAQAKAEQKADEGSTPF